MLQKDGINADIFEVQSVRAASIFAAEVKGLPLDMMHDECSWIVK